LISSAKDDSTRFWKTVEIIWGYLSSAPDSASVYAQQNILLGQKMKSDEALHMAYSQYTSLEQINGNYTGALQYGFQSLRMAERMKNFIGVCESHFDLADIYREAGDFEQAINNILKAKSLLESKLNPVFEHEKDTVIASHYVYSLVLLTQIFETFNRLDSAMQYGKKAQDLYLKRFPDSRFFPLSLLPSWVISIQKWVTIPLLSPTIERVLPLHLVMMEKRTSWTTTLAKPSLLKK
jgi:tetratricopeptide (TPR) repeat protein